MSDQQIMYRGWVIDRYRKPDWCFYAYAPDYDGLTPSDTQCGPTLHELCDEIDEVIASVDTRPEGGDSTKIEAPFTSGAVPHEDAGDAQ